VAEDEHVAVAVQRLTPPLPARGSAGFVHHRESYAGQLHPRHLGQPGPQRRPVIVAVHPDQLLGARLEPVEQRHVDPVAGVHHGVRRIDLAPHLDGQVAGPLRHVGIGDHE
jgi:hypothetical protein